MYENEQPSAATEIELVRQALEKGKRKRVRKLLRGMHPAKVASLLESLEPAQRAGIWQQVADDAEQSVLAHLGEELRGSLTQNGEGEEEGFPELEPGVPARTELARLRDALDGGRLKKVGRMLRQIHPAKAAGLLVGAKTDEAPFEEAARVAAGEAQPITDLRGTESFRRELVESLTLRALRDAADRARG